MNEHIFAKCLIAVEVYLTPVKPTFLYTQYLGLHGESHTPTLVCVLQMQLELLLGKGYVAKMYYY